MDPDGAAPGRRARRRPWTLLLSLAIVLELAVSLVGLRSAGRSEPTAEPRPTAAPQRTDVAGRPATPDFDGGLGADPIQRATRSQAVRTLLERRATALLHRDRAAFLATVDPQGGKFRSQQAALFDNLAGVPLKTWSYRLNSRAELPVDDASFARYRAPVWAPEVTLVYALRDVDPVPTERPQYLTFVRRGERWYLGADQDFAKQDHRSWRGLWDYGRVVTHRGRYSLVLAHPGNADRMADFAETVDAAVPHVTQVWGNRWTQRVAVLIPDDQAEMSEVIGGEFALLHIAAVATADYTDPDRQIARGQRVIINPTNLDRLGRLARDVVLRHEITHIASRAVTRSDTPTWLMEGFADYVGYLEADVPLPVAARDLRTEVRDGRVPGEFPTNEDFRGDSPDLPQAYEEAWMACRMIADRIGQDGLVRFYRAVAQSEGGAATAVDRAARAFLRMSSAQLVAAWKRYLVAELS